MASLKDENRKLYRSERAKLKLLQEKRITLDKQEELAWSRLQSIQEFPNLDRVNKLAEDREAVEIAFAKWARSSQEAGKIKRKIFRTKWSSPDELICALIQYDIFSITEITSREEYMRWANYYSSEHSLRDELYVRWFGLEWYRNERNYLAAKCRTDANEVAQERCRYVMQSCLDSNKRGKRGRR